MDELKAASPRAGVFVTLTGGDNPGPGRPEKESRALSGYIAANFENETT